MGDSLFYSGDKFSCSLHYADSFIPRSFFYIILGSWNYTTLYCRVLFSVLGGFMFS